MTDDPLSVWLGFLTSPAAPRGAMQPMILDGYLTGVIVAPAPIPPSRWLPRVWGDDEPVFDGRDQVQTAIGAVMGHYNHLAAALDDGFKRLEAGEPYAYRPLFQMAGGKPKHEIVRTWMTGFGRAMALTQDAWGSFIADERMQRVMAPLIGFIGVDDQIFDPADDADALLDEAAAGIPRSIILLRKLALLGASLKPQPKSRAKTGRNDPCPCASGRKYKLCCGAD